MAPSMEHMLAHVLLLLLPILPYSVHGFDVSTRAFDDGYSHLFGEGNLVKSSDGRSVQLLLERSSGSGFISSDMYKYGFFSSKIKLPSDYTAGVVVAFYTSNGDVFEKTHDELDFEFLGNIKGKEWRIQTNIYGNGSTSRGREERYFLPFDPTKEFHRYSILWTSERIVFYIDDTPIREVLASRGGDYPSKPMSVYATIWDASNWATSGGRYKVNYKYAPFVAKFSHLTLHGCPADPIQQLPISVNCTEFETQLVVDPALASITPNKRRAMKEFREKYMTYSCCYDDLRYPDMLPDCTIIPSEKRRFRESGHLKFGNRHRRPKNQSKPAYDVYSNKQADM